MINKKIICLEFSVLVGVLITLGLVNAFGAGLSYSVDDPLKLNPGQSADVLIGLQGSVSDGDLLVFAEIEQGSDIAKIADSSSTYLVNSSKDIGAVVNLKVSVPENAPVGTEYIVKVRYRDVTSKEGGMVGIALSLSNSFKVVVVEKPREEAPAPAPAPEVKEGMSTTMIIVLIVAIIIVIAIILLLIKKKK